MVEVAHHPVGRGNIVLGRFAGAENEYTGMLQVVVDNGDGVDGVFYIFMLGVGTADAADDHVDMDTSFGGKI